MIEQDPGRDGPDLFVYFSSKILFSSCMKL